jgi:hypothetical protein
MTLIREKSLKFLAGVEGGYSRVTQEWHGLQGGSPQKICYEQFCDLKLRKFFCSMTLIREKKSEISCRS